MASSTATVYTREQVATHASLTDCWTIIHNGVYNVTDYLNKHPGGAKLIMKVAGADGTRDFEALFHSQRARGVLETLKIGMVPSDSSQSLLNPSLMTRMPVASFAASAGQKTGPYGLPLNPSSFSSSSSSFSSSSSSSFKFGSSSRPAATPSSPPAAAALFRTATLESTIQRTPSTKLYRFKTAEPLDSLPPGHHLTLYLPTSSLKRPYTPILTGADFFDVLIKRYPDGQMSTHLDQLALGGTVSFTGPNGTFVLPASRPLKLLMLAGGTGIAPFYTLLVSLAGLADIQVVLLYSAKTDDEILLRDELARLAEKLPLAITFTLTQAGDEWEGRRGRINAELLAQQEGITDTLICGPPTFNDQLRMAVSSLKNLRESRMHLFH